MMIESYTYTQQIKSLGSVWFFFNKEIDIFIQQGHIELIKVTVKMFTLLQKKSFS